MTTRVEANPIGLIAGWGRFPVQVAQAARDAGHEVHVIAIRDHALPEIQDVASEVCWSGVGRLGGHLRFFKRRRVREVTMAGKLFKSDLLYSRSLLRHLPDLTCLRTFGPLLLGRNRDARDDRLLTAVTNLYSRSGLFVRAATDLAPELLVSEGHLAGPSPSPTQLRDAEFGWTVAKQIGGMDIGQSVTIKDGTVIAVEAIEGTDACIRRTGQLCGRGGWTLVKTAKPKQDMRFDVPTIGPQTIEQVSLAGGRCIVIEADKTIVVDQTETYAAARAAGITIVARVERSCGLEDRVVAA